MGKIGCATVNESNPPKLTYPFGPIRDGSLWTAKGRVLPEYDKLREIGIQQVIDIGNGIKRMDCIDGSHHLHGLKWNGIPVNCFKNNEKEGWRIDFHWLDHLRNKTNLKRGPIRNYVFSKFHAKVSQYSESATVGEQLYRFNFSNRQQVRVFSNSPLSREHLGNLADAISKFPSRMFVLFRKGIFVADCLEGIRMTQTGETDGAYGFHSNGNIFIEKPVLNECLATWHILVHEGAGHVLDWMSDWKISREIIGSDGNPLFCGGDYNPQEHIDECAAQNKAEDFARTSQALFRLLSERSVPLEKFLAFGSQVEIPFSAWRPARPESPKVLSPKIREKMQAIVELYRLNEDLTFQSSPVVLPDFSRRAA